MASQLRVDEIIASTGSSVAIGTAGGSVTLAGDFTVDTSKGLNVGTGATIFSPSSNVLTLGTNSAERVRIDASGRIGFGTNSPQTALHLFGSTPIIRLQDSDSTGTATVQRIEGTQTGSTQWFVGQNSTSDNELWIQNVTNDDIRFGTNNTERLRITNIGNIGIGVTNPQTALVVNRDWINNYGSINIKSSSDVLSGVGFRTNGGYAGGFIYRDGTTGNFFELNAQGSREIRALLNGSERLRIDSSGNIGAGGITTPTFTTGGGIHLGDAYGIGFGNGANGRPDFQIVYDTGQNFGLQIRCGNGADTADVYFTTAGNLAFDSGKGIDFSATSDGSGTASSEILDDYEEGTWTPTIRSYPNTITYSGGTATHFTYTKIGNQVTVYFILDGQTTSGTTGGAMRVDGLPYAPAVGTNWRTVGPPMFFYSSGLRANDWPVFPHLNNGSSTVQFYYKGSATSNYVETTVANVGTGSYVFFQVTYQVN